jgi:predicted DCC family thiol-disulfide oxidoreductase YuxK
MPLWRWGYRQVAKRRYRIAGKTGETCETDACKVHSK